MNESIMANESHPSHPLADWRALRTDPPAPRMMSVRDCDNAALDLATPELTAQIAQLTPVEHDDIGSLTGAVLVTLSEQLVGELGPDSRQPAHLAPAARYSAEVLRALAAQPCDNDLVGDVGTLLTGATSQITQWVARGDTQLADTISQWVAKGHPEPADVSVISAGVMERLQILVRALRGVMPPRQAAYDAQVRSPQHTAWLIITAASKQLQADGFPLLTSQLWRRARQHMADIATAAGGIDDPSVTLMASRTMRCLAGEPSGRGEPSTDAVVVSAARFLAEHLDAAAASERLRRGENARRCAEYLEALSYGAIGVLSPDDPIAIAWHSNRAKDG